MIINTSPTPGVPRIGQGSGTQTTSDAGPLPAGINPQAFMSLISRLVRRNAGAQPPIGAFGSGSSATNVRRAAPQQQERPMPSPLEAGGGEEMVDLYASPYGNGHGPVHAGRMGVNDVFVGRAKKSEAPGIPKESSFQNTPDTPSASEDLQQWWPTVDRWRAINAWGQPNDPHQKPAQQQPQPQGRG